MLYDLPYTYTTKIKKQKPPTKLTEKEEIGFVTTRGGVGGEKAMAPYSSTLAWKIPWTEEPGGPWSMGSLRVGHN